MSTTLIVIIAFLAALVGLITFNFYRTKNMKPVADSDRIKVLGNKNFKPVIRRGITLKRPGRNRRPCYRGQSECGPATATGTKIQGAQYSYTHHVSRWPRSASLRGRKNQKVSGKGNRSGIGVDFFVATTKPRPQRVETK